LTSDAHRLHLVLNDPEVTISTPHTRSLPLPAAAVRCRCSLFPASVPES
jgi:hypothetical protein